MFNIPKDLENLINDYKKQLECSDKYKIVLRDLAKYHRRKRMKKCMKDFYINNQEAIYIIVILVVYILVMYGILVILPPNTRREEEEDFEYDCFYMYYDDFICFPKKN